MPRLLSDAMLDPKTPASVEVRCAAPAPVTDPTLGVEVVPRPAPRAQHRLAAIGDSLVQGFQSGAIYNTALAFPRIIAWELGADRAFRYPRYEGFGGLPLNIEYVVRRMERDFGDEIDWWQLGWAVFRLRSILDEIEDYWERGRGSRAPELGGILHNLGMYGWDIRDLLDRTPALARAAIATPSDDWVRQVVEHGNHRAALRVFPGAPEHEHSTLLDAAEALGRDGGIETLIVLVGSNHALGSVVRMKVVWSGDGYDDLEQKQSFTVWDPEHFESELRLLLARIRRIDARHVIFGTVPHVTIAPVARGVASKVAPDSRYFPYYTLPWISDADFDPSDDPRITENEARAVDSAIDQYNAAIVRAVREARQDPHDPRDWLVVDVAGMLDRLAHRRYIESPGARPEWWTPYELPALLQRLSPVPDSRFFASGPRGRSQGGLFSLDGVHPTTIGYGLLAQEFIDAMQLAGVEFFLGDGTTRRSTPVQVDFERLIALDTLICDPPRSFTNDLRLLGWIDEKTEFVRRLTQSLI